ncbi:MAG: Ig-like domain-containing protein [Gemmatimonadales bacterium]
MTGTGAVTTGADGTAGIEWVLGRFAGTANNRLAAVVEGAGLETEFVASATAGPAVRLVPITPGAQTADAGAAVPLPPRVRLADQFDNSIVAQPVVFAVGPSGGTLDGQAERSVITDADGIAAIGIWQLGSTPGSYFVTATVTGAGNELIQGNPARFDATAAPPFGPPVAMTVVQGGGQTATVGSSVPMLPAVQLTDAQDRPVPGAEVVFSVAAGSGSITGAVATTDGTGTATLGGWTLGTGAGPQTVTATGPAGVAPATLDFQVAAVAGPASTIVKVAGDNQFSTAGGTVAVRPTVEVRDQFGNPVAGVSVTFAIESGGGSVAGPNQVTDAQGRARVGAWILGAPGAQLLVAQVFPPVADGMVQSVVLFSATAVVGEGAPTTAVRGLPPGDRSPPRSGTTRASERSALPGRVTRPAPAWR